jgi:hypothetical protein
MKLKLIACNVFFREISLCAALSPHTIDVEFTDVGEHVHSDSLRQSLQAKINAAAASGKYNAIALAFGICGNTTVGLKAVSVPLIIPRAHDCCTILLGDKEMFHEHFAAHPSTPFASAGYMERSDYFLRADGNAAPCDCATDDTCCSNDNFADYVTKYGEENAQFIWDSLHPKRTGENNRAVFIEIAETASLGKAEEFRKKAAAEGKDILMLTGSLRLLRQLVNCDWDDRDFLVIQPGQRIAGIYDWAEIIRAVPAN